MQSLNQPFWTLMRGSLWIGKMDVASTTFHQAFRPIPSSVQKRHKRNGVFECRTLSADSRVDGRQLNKRGGNVRRKQYSVFEKMELLEEQEDTQDNMANFSKRKRIDETML